MDDERYYDVGTALAAKLGQIIDGLDAGLTADGFRLRVSTALGRITDTVNGFLEGLTFEEADLTFVCRKLYQGEFQREGLADEISSGIYGNWHPHWMFVGEILEVEDKREPQG